MDKVANNFSLDVVIDDGSCHYINTSLINIEKIKIYPQPASEKIFIEIDSQITKAILIHDINQKVLYEESNINSNKNEINISDLDSGVYFIVVITEKEKIINKIIKE